MKIAVWAIERIFKNWITTVLGLLLGFCAIVASVYNLIPSELVWNGYPVAATLLKAAGVALALAGAIAQDKHIKINPPALPNDNSKLLMILFVLAFGSLFSAPVYAQNAPATDSNIYGAGVSYSVNASPAIAGTGLYARLITGSTYAFTSVDAVPNTLKPFTVTSNIGVGVAQKVLTLGGMPVFCVTGAGPSWTGSNVGWQYNGGCLGAIPYKKLLIMPNVRFLKSSVSNGSGYQPIIGVMFGASF